MHLQIRPLWTPAKRRGHFKVQRDQDRNLSPDEVMTSDLWVLPSVRWYYSERPSFLSLLSQPSSGFDLLHLRVSFHPVRRAFVQLLFALRFPSAHLHPPPHTYTPPAAPHCSINLISQTHQCFQIPPQPRPPTLRYAA